MNYDVTYPEDHIPEARDNLGNMYAYATIMFHYSLDQNLVHDS